MNTADRYSIKFPNARASTLAYLRKRDATTAKLQAEIAAARSTPKTRLAAIVKKINELIGRE